MDRRKMLDDLYDPRQGDPPIHIQDLHLNDGEFHEPSRSNYFSIYLIKKGSGTFLADTSCFEFSPSVLLCFVPYQLIRVQPDHELDGKIVRFHANFLCIETFHAEVGCSGLLFNDSFGSPLVSLDKQRDREISSLIERLQNEQRDQKLAYLEVMLASLKILLVLASRQKAMSSQTERGDQKTIDFRHPLLGPLKELVEQNYRVWHSPTQYAQALHTTPKSLGRVVKEHLGTTLTDLIRGRILRDAKWQLLHTLLSVKEIARNVGFLDELYFSRLFKKSTGYSPTFFREFETEIRGGSNLSMLSSATSILRPSLPPDT